MARNSVVIMPTSFKLLSRLMAATEIARSDGIQGFIETLWNPFSCPVEFLPFLAWALSVDVWDNAWPEAVKRDVIAASPEVHRRKGTVYAIERALEALGIKAVINEWHLQEPVGRHGTFHVDAVYDSSSLFNKDRVESLATLTVRRTKPKSRVFSIRKILKATAVMYMGAYPSHGARYVAALPDDDPIIHPNTQFIGAASLYGGTHTAGMEVN